MLGGIFFTRWWESEAEWIWQFEPFPKLKTAFCEYWTSIKIKISMTCVSQEYEIKTKIIQEQWLQLKITFLFGSNLKFFYLVGELTFGGGSLMEEDFSRWGDEQIFGWWGRLPPIPPQLEKSCCMQPNFMKLSKKLSCTWQCLNDFPKKWVSIAIKQISTSSWRNSYMEYVHILVVNKNLLQWQYDKKNIGL